MERRARSLLAKMPDHDSTTVYLEFSSPSPSRKRAAMESHGLHIDRVNVEFRERDESADSRARGGAWDEDADRTGSRGGSRSGTGDADLPDQQDQHRPWIAGSLGAVDVHV